MGNWLDKEGRFRIRAPGREREKGKKRGKNGDFHETAKQLGGRKFEDGLSRFKNLLIAFAQQKPQLPANISDADKFHRNHLPLLELFEQISQNPHLPRVTIEVSGGRENALEVFSDLVVLMFRFVETKFQNHDGKLAPYLDPQFLEKFPSLETGEQKARVKDIRETLKAVNRRREQLGRINNVIQTHANNALLFANFIDLKSYDNRFQGHNSRTTHLNRQLGEVAGIAPAFAEPNCAAQRPRSQQEMARLQAQINESRTQREFV